MATRATSKPDNCTFVTRTVETSTTVTVGCLVIDGNADGECQPATSAIVLPIGIVTALGSLAGAAGDKVTVALLNGGVVPVKTGGTATRGQSAKYVAAGGLLGDCVPDYAAGATDVWSPGYFMESGSSGDVVGLALMRHSVTE